MRILLINFHHFLLPCGMIIGIQMTFEVRTGRFLTVFIWLKSATQPQRFRTTPIQLDNKVHISKSLYDNISLRMLCWPMPCFKTTLTMFPSSIMVADQLLRADTIIMDENIYADTPWHMPAIFTSPILTPLACHYRNISSSKRCCFATRWNVCSRLISPISTHLTWDNIHIGLCYGILCLKVR